MSWVVAKGRPWFANPARVHSSEISAPGRIGPRPKLKLLRRERPARSPSSAVGARVRRFADVADNAVSGECTLLRRRVRFAHELHSTRRGVTAICGQQASCLRACLYSNSSMLTGPEGARGHCEGLATDAAHVAQVVYFRPRQRRLMGCAGPVKSDRRRGCDNVAGWTVPVLTGGARVRP